MSFFINKILSKCLKKKDVSYENSLILFYKIVKKKISLISIVAILIALKIKGESEREILAAVKILRKFSLKISCNVNLEFLDIVGTGGDKYCTYNISTASIFVASAAGINIIKHGGKYVSSVSGSADVLKKIGVNIYLKPRNILYCISKIGIGFLLSSNFYTCIKDIFFLRKEIGIKTIFNVIAPLINPFYIQNIFIGVFNKKLINIYLNILKYLNFKRVIIVCGKDNLDEVTLNGYTNIGLLINKKNIFYKIFSENFYINLISSNYFNVLNIYESKKIIFNIFSGIYSPYSDILISNIGLVLYTMGITSTLNKGVKKSREIINTGLALKKINKFVDITNIF